MSTEPTGLGNTTCEDILNKKYMDVRINKRNGCTYKGECQ